MEFARTIHAAGTDLMNLISDILDLSKIELGTVSVDAEEIYFTNLIETVARPFRHEAETPPSVLQRRSRPPSQPQHRHRLQAPAAGPEEPPLQRLQVHRARRRAAAHRRARHGGWSADHPILSKTPSVVAFEVTDTGIGISPRSRRSSSRPSSRPTPAPAASTAAPASGSRSAASLPTCSAARSSCAARRARAARSRSTCRSSTPGPPRRRRRRSRRRRRRVEPAVYRLPERPIEQLPDDRDDLRPGDMVLLIVEDDPHYAPRARRSGARQRLQGAGRRRPAPTRIALANDYHPTAISLDVFLPDMLGWTVLSQLKQNPATRHIPVQIVTLEEDRQHGLVARRVLVHHQAGEHGRPAERRSTRIKDFTEPRRKRLLVVEDNAAERFSITELLGPRGYRHRHRRERRRGALAILRNDGSDCVVLDLQAARHERLRGAGKDPRR